MASDAIVTLRNSDWIAGLTAGRDETLTALRARIREGLGAAFARRSAVSDADLDDLTQDAMLQVLDRLNSFRGDSSFTTWAMAVAVRVSLTALRRRRWATEPLGQRLAELASPGWSGGRGNSASARGELFAVLRAAIADQLTPRQRQVLLGELEGIPQVVLAERLSATPGAIYKVSHDARKKLKLALAEAGFDAEAVAEVLTRE